MSENHSLDPKKIHDISDPGAFWKRIGGKPDFSGSRVLEVGCASGGLAISIAKTARSVIAIDIVPELIEFAEDNVKKNHPSLKDKIAFKISDLQEFLDESFDFVISKDSFEHIINFKTLFNEMKRVLKVGGKMIVGFGPIYTSPYGFHRVMSRSVFPWMKVEVPWLHLLFPDHILMHQWNATHGTNHSKVQDIGLNKLPYSYYRKTLREGMRVMKWNINVGNRFFAKILNKFALVPFFTNYCIFNLYAVLEKV